MSRIVVSWSVTPPDICEGELQAAEGPAPHKLYLVDRGSRQRPECDETWICEIVKDTKPGQRKGVVFVRLIEPIRLGWVKTNTVEDGHHRHVWGCLNFPAPLEEWTVKGRYKLRQTPPPDEHLAYEAALAARLEREKFAEQEARRAKAEARFAARRERDRRNREEALASGDRSYREQIEAIERVLGGLTGFVLANALSGDSPEQWGADVEDPDDIPVFERLVELTYRAEVVDDPLPEDLDPHDLCHGILRFPDGTLVALVDHDWGNDVDISLHASREDLVEHYRREFSETPEEYY